MSKPKAVLLLMPVFVILFTRTGIEICARLLPVHYSWIPSFMFYYASIELCLLYARRKLGIKNDKGPPSAKSFPGRKYFFVGLLLPAVIPLPMFILNVRAVPLSFMGYILLFAILNPYFEESFWRGLLSNIPASNRFRIFYSSLLFCSTHYFLWGSYWLLPAQKWIAAVISTFIMGVLWMWFYLQKRNLVYPVISHALVDIFNLSIAIFYGLKLITI